MCTFQNIYKQFFIFCTIALPFLMQTPTFVQETGCIFYALYRELLPIVKPFLENFQKKEPFLNKECLVFSKRTSAHTLLCTKSTPQQRQIIATITLHSREPVQTAEKCENALVISSCITLLSRFIYDGTKGA